MSNLVMVDVRNRQVLRNDMEGWVRVVFPCDSKVFLLESDEGSVWMQYVALLDTDEKEVHTLKVALVPKDCP